MSFFTKKNFLYKLIICLCIIFALMNSTGVQRVYAADDGSGIGGVLITPICDLLAGLGDAIMNILQKSIMGQKAIMTVDNSDPAWYETVWGWIVAVAVIAIGVIILVHFGWLAAVLAQIGKMAISAAKIYGTMCLVLGIGATNSAVVALSGVAAEALKDTVVLPQFLISPEEIFSGRILLFDANIFNPKQVYVEYENNEDSSEKGVKKLQDWNDMDTAERQQYHATGYYYGENCDGEGDADEDKIYTSTNNSAYELSGIIAKWYYVIRTIALVGSMLILLYIGIRIIISSIAEEKAKYKQMLSDWIVAMCLIVLMHYIMIFAHNIVESITDIFNNVVENKGHVVAIDGPGDNLKKAIEDYEDETGQQFFSEDGESIIWPTNLMGKFRLEAQEADAGLEHVGYTMAYLALVLFTLIFSFTYIKRLLYLLFLTVIAPFVALTYPIDKIHDGKAQAFDMWLKEYIFNLLIQPFHLLLYTIFVGMAFELAATNVIYSLVVLGFMVPAEKFLRTMFGFNKSSTSDGLFAGASGAALAMSAVSSLGKFAKGGGHGGKGSGDKKGEKEDNGYVRTKDDDKNESGLLNDLAGQGTEQQPTLTEGNNENGLPSIEDERERLAAERETLDGFLDELTTPGTETRDEDIAAYEELEREQLEAEERLRQRELAEAAQRQQQEQQAVVEQQQISQQTQQRQGPKKVKGSMLGAIDRGIKRKTGSKTTGEAALKIAGSAAGAVIGTGFKAAGTVAGTMLGATTGIVAGDPGSAFKNASVGAGAGLAVTSGINNRVSSSLKGIPADSKAINEQLAKDYYGDDYDEYMRQKSDKEFMKDKELKKLYDKKLGLNGDKEKIERAMKDAQKYREYGINDNSVIIRAMRSSHSTTERASKERIAAAKFAEKCKSEKDLQTHMKRLREVPNMSKTQAQNIEKLVRDINHKHLE